MNTTNLFLPLIIASLALMSCEGATYVNHHFNNKTNDTLRLGLRSNEAETGWKVDTVIAIPPGETYVHYAVDFLGKCHDCSLYEIAPYGLDSIWVEGDSLTINALDAQHWSLEMDEGRSWIRFDQHLDLENSMFD